MPKLLRLLPFFLLPILVACDNSPKAPQTQTPASPAAETPARPAAASPAAHADAATAPLIGSWAADLAQCGSGAITITASRFEGAENDCDIQSFTPSEGGSLVADMSCGGKAERVQMTPVFAPTGEGINLVYLDRNSAKTTVLRCRATQD